VTIEGQAYRLNKTKEQEALKRAIDARIRFASSVNEREAYLREVRQLLAVPYAVTLEEKKLLPMSWEEIEDMKKSGWISFGSHTMHHPLLAHLSDPGEAEYEVSEAGTQLERHLGTPVRSFAYPVGRFEDIEEQGIRSVQKAGYAWAVTTLNGWNTPQSNPYLLHRLTVDEDQHWLLMAAMVSDVRHLFPNLLKASTKFLQRLAGRTALTRARNAYPMRSES
jgi:hypothetical protein